jgi:uncharacterized protein (TIGR03089 family)
MADAWSALQARKRSNPGSPLVTYVDAEHAERVELSGASVENAAAKIANALRDEFDLDQGSTVRLRLPLHWQRTAWTAGVWTAGCTLILDDAVPADLEVMDERSAATGAPWDHDVLAVSLHPFGLPIPTVLPEGVLDVTIPVRSQPDAYLYDPPASSMLAMRTAERAWTQDDVWSRASDLVLEWDITEGGRILVTDDRDPVDAVIAALTLPLVCGGSVVLAVGAVHVDELVAAERVTAIAGRRR